MKLKKNLIKSFLTIAIGFLFLSNGSFLTNAEDTLFSIEGMNMSQTNGGSGGGGGDTAAVVTEVMRQLSQAGVIQGGTGAGQNGIYRGNGTTFNYEERVGVSSGDGVSEGSYKTILKDQMNTFISSGSYTGVENVDLDNDGHEEILVTNGSDFLIYEWNGTTFIWSKFYTLDKTNKDQTYFLRLEDEYGNKIYYLMVYRTNTSSYRRSRAIGNNGRRYNNKGEKGTYTQSRIRGHQTYTGYFKLYAKGDDSFTNREYTYSRDYPHHVSVTEYLYAGDGNYYGYDQTGKFFFKNDDGVVEYYTDNGHTQSIGGRTVYRYVKDSSYTGGSTIAFATATTSEKKPYTTGNTIATSEYDKFVTKTNSDGTYNYKITLEKPDGSTVVAFYGLQFNGIIFKDLNGDGVKDIITYEDYVSEDSVQFKRMYIFLFDPSDYIYKKVMDGVDALQYQWQDVDDDGDLDIFIRRYDEKLYLYRNNLLESDFSEQGAIRGKYFLFKDLIHNGKHQIITKNMSNNDVAGEWKIYNVDGEGYFNTTGTYENGLVGENYKTYDIDGNTNNLIGIRKAANQYKMFYYNSVSGFIEDFPEDFRITDLTNTYIYNNETGNVAFKKLDGNMISFFKDPETGKYYNTGFYRASNKKTFYATEESEGDTEYLYNGETYYVASNKADIQAKIAEGFDGGHIITTKVSDMSGLFQNNTTFNDDISNWDVRIVNNISNMFNGATSFNQNLSGLTFFNGINNHSWSGYDTGASSWTSSNKPNLRSIFTKSNGVTKYCPSNLADGTYVVNGTTYYVVSTKAQIQSYLLGGNFSKSPYIVTTKVTDMSNLFYSGNIVSPGSRRRCSGCTNTRREPNCSNSLNNINPSGAQQRRRGRPRSNANYHNMFNGDIRSWDTSNVTTMENMFRQNHCFNQDISKWDTAKVTNMNYMFSNENELGSAFKQNIKSWNVTKVGANHTGLRCSGCTWPTWSA